MSLMNVYRDIEAERSRERQFQVNSARLAYDFVTIQSQGYGELILGEEITFKTVFVNEPSVASGFAIEAHPDPEVAGLPRVTAGVYRWAKNDRGFYTGAFLYVIIDVTTTQPEVVNTFLEISHHFTFSGLSYKKAGSALTTLANDKSVTPATLPTLENA